MVLLFDHFDFLTFRTVHMIRNLLLFRFFANWHFEGYWHLIGIFWLIGISTDWLYGFWRFRFSRDWLFGLNGFSINIIGLNGFSIDFFSVISFEAIWPLACFSTSTSVSGLSSVAEFFLQLRRANLGPFRLYMLKRFLLGSSSQLVPCLTGLNAKCWEVNGLNFILKWRFVS